MASASFLLQKKSRFGRKIGKLFNEHNKIRHANVQLILKMQNMRERDKQWGSEYRRLPLFKWLTSVRISNGTDFEHQNLDAFSPVFKCHEKNVCHLEQKHL